ncbi:FliH/SctL family protein [Enterococcus sp.]|jgi:flagellar assembly protein FliH|uniref:FliH/SctL family protein n=1 Tax=Enterococcus sp. TaxID=35783 RepID=UPI0025C0C719|nr:FliH/SctL family protein [Enterococcus sp.]
MQWSNSSLLKQETVQNLNKEKSILTEAVIKAPSSASTGSLNTSDSLEESLQKRKEAQREQAWKFEKEQELKKIEVLKRKTLEAAQAEAQRIKEAAQKEGYAQGLAEGQKAGYEQGYQEGVSASKETAAKLIAQAEKNVQQAADEINAFRSEKKAEMISFGVEIAEALINQRFEQSNAALLAFLEPILLQFEQPDQFLTIRIHEQYLHVLKDILESKKQEISNFRYLILPDDQLSAHDFVIESDDSLVVFELEKEIELYLQHLLESSE